MQSLAGSEFRTATLVAEELHQLGYSLALGREVVNESSRDGITVMNSLYNANSSALVNRVR